MKCNALLLVGLALTGCTTPPASTPVPVPSPPASCDHAFNVRDELYFGLSRPGGGTVTPAQWNRFLDSALTARFPPGFTVLEAVGQWRSPVTGEIVREPSRIVIIIHPHCAENERAISAIIAAYRKEFDQESVGRVTSAVEARF